MWALFWHLGWRRHTYPTENFHFPRSEFEGEHALKCGWEPSSLMAELNERGISQQERTPGWRNGKCVLVHGAIGSCPISSDSCPFTPTFNSPSFIQIRYRPQAVPLPYSSTLLPFQVLPENTDLLVRFSWCSGISGRTGKTDPACTLYQAKRECGTGKRTRPMLFGTENFTLQCQFMGGKEREGHKSEERSENQPSHFFFVCQSLKLLKGKETSLSPWPSQPRIPSRARAGSRPHSPSISTSVTMKTKKVKTPKKSAKEEQPLVRMASVTTPASTQGPLTVLLTLLQAHVPHEQGWWSPALDAPYYSGRGCVATLSTWCSHWTPWLPKRMPPLSSTWSFI